MCYRSDQLLVIDVGRPSVSAGSFTRAHVLFGVSVVLEIIRERALPCQGVREARAGCPRAPRDGIQMPRD